MSSKALLGADGLSRFAGLVLIGLAGLFAFHPNYLGREVTRPLSSAESATGLVMPPRASFPIGPWQGSELRFSWDASGWERHSWRLVVLDDHFEVCFTSDVTADRHWDAPLELLNRLAPDRPYHWQVRSATGVPPTASPPVPFIRTAVETKR